MLNQLATYNYDKIDKALKERPNKEVERYVQNAKKLSEILDSSPIFLNHLPQSIIDDMNKVYFSLNGLKNQRDSLSLETGLNQTLLDVTIFCSLQLLSSKELAGQLEKIEDLWRQSGAIVDRTKKMDEMWTTIQHVHVQQHGNFTAKINEVDASKTRIEQLFVEVEERLKQIDEEARRFAAQMAAEKFTTAFAEQSDACGKRSRIWLLASLISLLATVLASYFLFTDSGNYQAPLQLIHQFGSRLVVIGLLIAATIWCARMYALLSHQSLINKHRSLSIMTLVPFLNAVKDMKAKDAIVLQATKAVYDADSSGLSTLKPELPLADALRELGSLLRNAGQG